MNNTKNRIVAVLLTILITDTALAAGPFHKGSFSDASRLARRQRKVVMIDFYTTWCGPCKAMDETTWKDATVQAFLAKNTVAIKVDCDKDKTLPQKFGVSAYPTVLFASPDGTEIGRVVGYQDPPNFLTAASARLSKARPAGRKRGTSSNRLTRLPRRRPPPPEGNAIDPMARLAQARELGKQGKHAAALTAYLWCVDHGTDARSDFAYVRLSRVLPEIAQLGEDHPPALEALGERRKAAERAVLTGAAGADKVEELAALNNALGKSDRTLRTYDNLEKQGPAGSRLRHDMFALVVDLLLEQERYEDLLRDAAEAAADIDRGILFHDTLSTRMATDPSLDHRVLEVLRREIVALAGKYYEASLATDRQEQAMALADRVIEFHASNEVFTTFIEHALRAEAPDAAQALRDQAEQVLPEEDYARLSRTLPQIPAEEQPPTLDDPPGG